MFTNIANMTVFCIAPPFVDHLDLSDLKVRALSVIRR